MDGHTLDTIKGDQFTPQYANQGESSSGISGAHVSGLGGSYFQ